MLGLFGTAITPLLLCVAYSMIPSGVASTFHYSYPAITILATGLLLRKPIQKGHAFCVILCVTGIAMFCTSEKTLNLIGAGAALLSGFTFATYIVLLDYFCISSMSSQKMTFYMAIESAIALLIACVASRKFHLPDNLVAIGCCILVAFLQTVGATVLFQKGIVLIGGPRASILSTFEPITSIAVGVLVFSEPFPFKTVIGSLLVVMAAVLIAVFDLMALKKQTI